jgi:hypothetical protein
VEELGGPGPLADKWELMSAAPGYGTATCAFIGEKQPQSAVSRYRSRTYSSRTRTSSTVRRTTPTSSRYRKARRTKTLFLGKETKVDDELVVTLAEVKETPYAIVYRVKDDTSIYMLEKEDGGSRYDGTIAPEEEEEEAAPTSAAKALAGRSATNAADEGKITHGSRVLGKKPSSSPAGSTTQQRNSALSSRGPRKPTAEDLKRLRDVSKKIPASARKKIEKAMTGGARK